MKNSALHTLCKFPATALALAVLSAFLPSTLRADEFSDVTVDSTLSVGADANITGNLVVGTDTNITGNLNVGQEITATAMHANSLNLGGRTGEGFYINTDESEIVNGTITVTSSTHDLADWMWAWVDGYTYPQMTLDHTGVFTINGYDFESNIGNITLDAVNGTIAINGTAFDSFGDVFYVGDEGFTAGNLALATGTRSAAFGGSANATGLESVALSNGTAGGARSTALSYGNAVGNFSVAMGSGTSAGNNSLAFGSDSLANATGALALGVGTETGVLNSIAIGHYNEVIAGNATTYVAEDPAFIVGIGQNGTARANGLVVLNNGDTVIPGNTTLGGNTTTTTLYGNVTIAAPQGDIPMGMYGN